MKLLALYLGILFLIASVESFHIRRTKLKRVKRRLFSADDEDLDAGNIMTDYEFDEFLTACKEAACGSICNSL